MCWALLLQGHMLCKGGIAGILLRKTKEENPLLLQRQSHFAPQNKAVQKLTFYKCCTMMVAKITQEKGAEDL